MHKLRLRTLFGKTLFTIVLVSILFWTFTMVVIFKFLLLPVGQRSAEDLVALMLQSAETWQNTSPSERPAYRASIQRRYGLDIGPYRPELPKRGLTLPYFYFVEHMLAKHTGNDLRFRVEQRVDGEYYWAAVPSAQGMIDMGIPRSHITVQPPLALLLVLSMGTLATMVTAVALVRRLTAPLERLSRAARRIGSGEWPEPLPEDGPEELAELARRFNSMVVQVQELLANRTTLLAGISHDLRTPLSRTQIALEMLPAETDADLVEGIRDDLEQMNELISQFLGVARGLEERHLSWLELKPLLGDLVDSARRTGHDVRLLEGPSCQVEAPELALQRVTGNLLDNAMRYGQGKPVEVEWHCSGDKVAIHVLDRGPGIPPDQTEAVFRPFYRLEHSRSRKTGGSGLGLAIARQLALANGWDISLHSRHGGGTRAVLKLGNVEPV